MSPTSIFARVVGLAFLVLIISMGISILLLLLLPAPSPGRMNVEEMIWALDAKPSSVINADIRIEAPSGRRSSVIEATLAKALRVNPSDVRAVWIGDPSPSLGSGESVMLVGGRDVLVSSSASEVTLRYGDRASVGRRTIIPLFIGAVKLKDGNWRWGVPHDPARTSWTWRIFAAFLATALLLAGPVWLMARRLVAPIEALGRVAAAIRLKGESPFPVAGPREVQATAAAMNQMHGRLVAQSAERVRMVAAIAHDLRTPITALRLRVNDVSEPLRARMTSDLVRMSGMIAELLDFAKLDAHEPQICLVDLTALVRTCVAIRQDAGDDIVLAEMEDITLLTDPLLASRAIENLIDNAIRYGGRTKVNVETSGMWATVQIIDEGPGIPDHLIGLAMKPFERLDDSRNREGGGTGLGLSIVSHISDVLGLQFGLINRQPGLAASLAFPIPE